MVEQEHETPETYLQKMYEQNTEQCDARLFRRRHPGDAAEVPLGGTGLEGGALPETSKPAKPDTKRGG